MNVFIKLRPMICASALVLAGCAASGPQQNAQQDMRHLSATQCRDLAALRNHAPPSRERNASELTALRQAGYDPSKWYDPYYPDDLQVAQRRIDRWFQTDCQPAQPN